MQRKEAPIFIRQSLRDGRVDQAIVRSWQPRQKVQVATPNPVTAAGCLPETGLTVTKLPFFLAASAF